MTELSLVLTGSLKTDQIGAAIFEKDKSSPEVIKKMSCST